jgi:hypothetical protein
MFVAAYRNEVGNAHILRSRYRYECSETSIHRFRRGVLKNNDGYGKAIDAAPIV